MRDVLRDARRSFPFIERIFADAGYQGPKAAKTVADTGRWVIEIVKRSDAQLTSSSSPNAGSSNEPWPGSAAIAAWHATSSVTPDPSRLSCASP